MKYSYTRLQFVCFFIIPVNQMRVQFFSHLLHSQVIIIFLELTLVIYVWDMVRNEKAAAHCIES